MAGKLKLPRLWGRLLRFSRWLEPAAVAGGSSSSMDPHNPVGPMGAALGIGEIERRERGDDEPREE